MIVLLSLGLTSLAGAPVEASPHHRTDRAAHVRLVVFKHGHGVFVRNRRTARRLHHTTAAFRKFAARLGRKADGNAAGCGETHDGIWVLGYTSNGFGIGEGDDCASLGGMTIFGRKHGHWRILTLTQEYWDCRALRRAKPPLKLIKRFPMAPDSRHNCYNYAQGHPGHYRG
jgi:hypothetical protein